MRGGSLAFIPLQLSLKRCHHISTSTSVLHFSTTPSSNQLPATSSANANNNKSNHGYLDTDNKFLERRGQLAASKLGLPPNENRFHQPIVYHPNYSFPEWPPNQTFPMSKFHHLALNLTSRQPHLPRPLVRSNSDFYQPLSHQDIPLQWFGPICPTFLNNFLSASLTRDEERRIGFRECSQMAQVRERTVLEVAGTVLAAQLALKYGIATNAAGGTHHASSEMGAGYTILNDLAITANYLMKHHEGQDPIQTVLVIDCDVHQGDGTAKFANIIGKGLVTLSLHCESNYPTLKANSTYDVGLPDGMEDDAYMEVLEKSVLRAIEETQPDFVLYDAGVDVHKDDFLGRLKLTEGGIRRRDRWVMETCVERGIPVVGVIGGGYDKDPLALARRHAIVHEEAAFVWRKHKMWMR